MTSIYDYLIWEPQGKMKVIADYVNTLSSSASELYRGVDIKELRSIQRDGKATSFGIGNTRIGSVSYLASDIKLAARFALVNMRDKGNGVILVLNKYKLPDYKQADTGNFRTSFIPIEAVKLVIDLSKIK